MSESRRLSGCAGRTHEPKLPSAACACVQSAENGHGFGIEHSVTNEVLRTGNDQAAKEMVATLVANVPR